MEVNVVLDASQLPELIKNNGVKAYYQSVKNSQNRALKVARSMAERIATETYDLPSVGSLYGPQGAYSRPSVDSVLESDVVRSIRGIEAGIPSTLLSHASNLSAIRFVESQIKPIVQKGIPVKRRHQEISFHRSVRKTGKTFIQRGRSKGRMHVFRRAKNKMGKMVMARVTVDSIHRVLDREQNQAKLTERAMEEFNRKFAKELAKRLS